MKNLSESILYNLKLSESAKTKVSKEDVDKLVRQFIKEYEDEMNILIDDFDRWTVVHTALDYIGDNEYRHLNFLTKYKLSSNEIHDLAVIIDDEIAKRVKGLNESVDNSSLANFIKDSINKLQTTDYTNCKYNLDENLAVFVGWSDGYDTEPLEDEIASEKCPTCRVNAVIAVRNDADWSDLDMLTVPYYTHDGEIYDCQYTISTKEDYRRLAGSLIQDYNEIKRLLASGELTLGDGLNESTSKNLNDNKEKLEKIIQKDKEEGKVGERLKKIEDAERYDRLYDKYKESGMSDEKIKSLLGEKPKTGLEFDDKDCIDIPGFKDYECNAKTDELNESNELKDSMLSDEELTNLYLMDRVLRCMNDESALSDGWLMNYIADGDSDYGADYIIDEYRDFMTKEDYEDAYNYYKELVKSTLDSGIISREYYKGKHGFKPNAGATKKEIQFVRKDFPNIKVISK